MAHQSKNVTASVTSFSTKPDLTPSDSQPPGVDDEPQSLEEALVGKPASDPSVNPKRRVRYSG